MKKAQNPFELYQYITPEAKFLELDTNRLVEATSSLAEVVFQISPRNVIPNSQYKICLIITKKRNYAIIYSWRSDSFITENYPEFSKFLNRKSSCDIFCTKQGFKKLHFETLEKGFPNPCKKSTSATLIFSICHIRLGIQNRKVMSSNSQATRPDRYTFIKGSLCKIKGNATFGGPSFYSSFVNLPISFPNNFIRWDNPIMYVDKKVEMPLIGSSELSNYDVIASCELLLRRLLYSSLSPSSDLRNLAIDRAKALVSILEKGKPYHELQ